MCDLNGLCVWCVYYRRLLTIKVRWVLVNLIDKVLCQIRDLGTNFACTKIQLVFWPKNKKPS